MKKRMKDRPGLLDDAARVSEAGRRGDKILAHITPEEAAILKARGGSGTVNPRTGILEFWESDPDRGDNAGAGSTAGEAGGGYGGGDGGGGRDYTDPMGSGSDYGQGGPTGPADPMGTGGDYTPSPGWEPPDLADLGGGSGGILGWVNSQVEKARNNPVATGINTLAGLALGPLGMVNTAMGFMGQPTIGSAMTSGVRSLTGYSDNPDQSGINAGADPRDFTPGNPPDNMTASVGGQTNPNTGAPMQMQQQMPQQIAQEALRRALIYKPQAYNSWQGNRFVMPGILG